MNLSDVNWDISAAGVWPLPVKIFITVLICLCVAGGWIYYDTMDQVAALEAVEKQEQQLKRSFEDKQKKAVNIQAYRDQLEQIKNSLGEMLRQLPTKAEVANLLIDISQTGLASGLEFNLFKPAGEINKEFYSELPINIKVTGRYEEFGLFVSGLASLPRIVTVHNVNIDMAGGKANKGDGSQMIMQATLKTYSESTAPPPKMKKGKKGRKR